MYLFTFFWVHGENTTFNKYKLNLTIPIKNVCTCLTSHALSGICNMSWLNNFRINSSIKSPTPCIEFYTMLIIYKFQWVYAGINLNKS